ncbi:MAG: pyroglutamyl-peptidase I, partial [Promicromonosporaceae bacterium]|nr:pyroglutamyl-peptidase I [Promicromonosporaceae bacterium]
MTKKVLLTGFEPFDGAEVNESWEAVRLVAQSWPTDGEAQLVIVCLPVTFDGAFAKVAEMIAENGPFDLILNTGLDARSASVKVERLAVNKADARIPDNAGFQPQEELLNESGLLELSVTLPVPELEERLRAADIPTEISFSAGTYVCNSVFYRVLAATANTETRAGFIHIPSASSLPISESARALT